jgi:hypothetical protein
LGLDGGGFAIADFGNGAQNFWAQPKIVKTHYLPEKGA